VLSALASMTPEQRAHLAAAFGMSPEQLAAVAAQGGGAGGGGGGGGMPATTRVALTADEAAAVRRLQDLGFSQQQALEAFLACDRDEQMAANYLFESGGE
jgi:UV excision repair protein RAD23